MEAEWSQSEEDDGDYAGVFLVGAISPPPRPVQTDLAAGKLLRVHRVHHKLERRCQDFF